MTSKIQQPRIGSYAILRQNGKIAFLLRTRTGWMNGYYTLPSGRVHVGEQPVAAAAREAKEEIDVTIDQKELVFTHLMHYSGKDEYIYIFFEAQKWQGKPINAEPKVHGNLAWFSLDELPENIVPPVKVALENIELGQIYSEYKLD